MLISGFKLVDCACMVLRIKSACLALVVCIQDLYIFSYVKHGIRMSMGQVPGVPADPDVPLPPMVRRLLLELVCRQPKIA